MNPEDKQTQDNLSAANQPEDSASTAPTSPAPVAGEEINPDSPAPEQSQSAQQADTSEYNQASTQSTAIESEASKNADAPAPSVFANTQPTKKSKKKTFGMIAMIVALLVFFIGGGAYTYMAVYVPNQPDNVMKAALANTLELALAEQQDQAYSFDGDIKLTNTQDTSQSGSMKMSAYYDGSNNLLDAHADIDALVTTLGLDVRRVSDETKTYYKVSGLDGLDSLLTSYLGSGESLDNNDQFTAFVQSIITGVNDQWFIVEDSLFDRYKEDAEVPTTLTEDGKATIKEAYLEHSFLVVQEQKEDQQIQGVDSMQYVVAVDKQELIAFARQIQAADIEGLKIDDDDISSIEEAELNETATLWVGKKSKQFTQIAFSTEEDDYDVEVRLSMVPAEMGRSVEKPSDAKSMLELMGELSPLFGGGALAPTAQNDDYELSVECSQAFQDAANAGDFSLVPPECDELSTQPITL